MAQALVKETGKLYQSFYEMLAIRSRSLDYLASHPARYTGFERCRSTTQTVFEGLEEIVQTLRATGDNNVNGRANMKYKYALSEGRLAKIRYHLARVNSTYIRSYIPAITQSSLFKD